MKDRFFYFDLLTYTKSLIFLLCFTFIFSGHSLFGQTTLDSLLKLAAQLPVSEKKVDIWYDIAFEYEYKLDSALVYADSILILSEKLNYKKGIGLSYNLRMKISESKEQYEVAIEYGRKAINLFEELNEKKQVSSLHYSICYIYQRMNRFLDASNELKEVLIISEELRDSNSMAKAYFRLGKIAENLQNPEEAISYQLKSLAIYQQLGKESEYFWNYYSLGNVEQNTDKQRDYFKKALKYIHYISPYRQELLKGVILNNIGYTYALENKSLERLYRKDAIESYKKAMEMALKSQNVYSLRNIYVNLGKTYSTIEMVDSAIFYTQKGIELLENVEGFSWELENGYQTLMHSYRRKGNYKKALKYSELAYEVRDSIFKKDIAQKTKENIDKFESERKEKQIAQQKLQIAEANAARNRIVLIAIGILALAVFLFQRFYYNQKRKKQETENALLQEKQEAEKLRELDRLKSSFFTNISHELRTPLTLVAAPLNDALQEVKPSLLKNTLQLANSNTQKLLRLVNEILDLSKLEAGKLEAKLSEVRLLPIVRRLFFAFESIAKVRGIQLYFNTNIPKDLKVHMDDGKFEKIINNLLANAVKFTEKGGNITLNAHQENGQFQFEVVDTGMGIAQEELPKIFDRFYQSTSPNAPLQGGTGIGLSLAKELAQLMQGDLTVSSKKGKGSRFILNLPLELANGHSVKQDNYKKERHESIVLEKSDASVITYTPILLNGQKPRVLIVEDNLEMSDYIAQNLSKDYECTQVYDGQEALDILQKESFDLITCDVMMPNLDGFSFREKLVTEENYRQTPFIMLTARAMDEDKLRGLRLGVDDYLTKPFNLDELKARVHNLLGNKIAREEFAKEVEVEEEKPLTHEEEFLQKAEAFVLQKLEDPQLRVDDIAKAMNLSYGQFARMVSKTTGLTPVNFILELRLQKARQLLENRVYATVAEVRYEIGIESASYFTKKFTKRFGKNPKHYLE